MKHISFCYMAHSYAKVFWPFECICLNLLKILFCALLPAYICLLVWQSIYFHTLPFNVWYTELSTEWRWSNPILSFLQVRNQTDTLCRTTTTTKITEMKSRCCNKFMSSREISVSCCSLQTFRQFGFSESNIKISVFIKSFVHLFKICVETYFS